MSAHVALRMLLAFSQPVKCIFWLMAASKLHKHRETCCTAEWPYCPFAVLWYRAKAFATDCPNYGDPIIRSLQTFTKQTDITRSNTYIIVIRELTTADTLVKGPSPFYILYTQIFMYMDCPDEMYWKTHVCS